MTEHARFNEAQGRAALGICESLLIALTELKVISRHRDVARPASRASRSGAAVARANADQDLRRFQTPR